LVPGYRQIASPRRWLSDRQRRQNLKGQNPKRKDDGDEGLSWNWFLPAPDWRHPLLGLALVATLTSIPYTPQGGSGGVQSAIPENVSGAIPRIKSFKRAICRQTHCHV
jgi:hypothetical protein